MTKGLEKAFGLPSLAEVLAESEVEFEETKNPNDTGVEIEQEDAVRYASPVVDTTRTLPSFVGTGDHGKSMDTIFDEALRMFRDTAEAAYQADMARTPRYLEVAGQYLKMAADAASEKHDAQLKAMKIAIEQDRLAMQKKQLTGTDPNGAVETEGVYLADRNEIVAQALAAMKSSKPSEDE